MDKKDQYKKLIRFLTGVIILAAHGMLFAHMWYSYYLQDIQMKFWRRGNWAVIGVYLVAMFLFTKIYGGYRVGYARVMDILYSQILGLVCANLYLYVELCIIGRDYMNPFRLIQMTVVQIGIIIIWAFGTKLVYAKIFPPRQMLLIYGEDLPTDFIDKVNYRKDRYNICDTISVDTDIEEIYERIDQHEAIVICECPSSIRNNIMKYSFYKSVRTYMVPKLSDILILGAEDMHLFDTPLLLARNLGLSGEETIIKRIMDVIISIIGIMIASPIMLIIAIILKISDKGPIFYRQTRLTIDGKAFEILKFRSMRVDSEVNGAQLAQKNDSRITPVGKILRSSHLDELPQLFNVFMGDMSLVGPRPERPEIMEEYAKYMPEFPYRLKAKAGLTGYAQVYGKYNTTPRDKLKLDITYIEKYSIWLDIKLMLLTVKIMFQKETSEGIEQDQVTAMKIHNEHKIDIQNAAKELATSTNIEEEENDGEFK